MEIASTSAERHPGIASRVEVWKYTAEIALEEEGVTDALKLVTAEYLEGNPESHAVWDLGYIRKNEGISAVGVVRWDPKEKDVPGVGKSIVSKAVRVVYNIRLDAEGNATRDFEGISTSSSKVLTEINPRTKKPKIITIWEPLLLSDYAEENFSLERKIRVAMDKVNALEKTKKDVTMFDDRRLVNDELKGSAGIGQRS